LDHFGLEGIQYNMQPPELKRSPQKSRGKNLIRWISRSVLILFIIILLILVFLALPPGESIIKNMAQDKLSIYLGQRVYIGDLKTNIFSNTQITGLRIEQKFDSLASPLLSIDRLNVSYSLWALTRKEIKINSISISGLQAHLVRRENGSYNLPTIFSSGEKKSQPDKVSKGFQVIVENIILKNSALYYRDRQANRVIDLQGLSFIMEQKKAKYYHFRIEADSGAANLSNHPLTLKEFMTRGQYGEGALTLDTLRLVLPDAALQGHTTIAIGTPSQGITGMFYLTSRTESYNVLFKNSIPADFYPVRANLTADIILRGKLKDPEISTTLNITNGTLGNRVPFSISMQAMYQTGNISLRSYDVNIFKGKISGNGHIQLDSLYNHQFSLRLASLSLKDVYQLLSPGTSTFSGLISGNIVSRGPLKEPYSITAQSNIFLTRMFYKSKSMADFRSTLSLAREKLTVNVEQGESYLEGTFTIRNNHIDGNYAADIHRIQPFMILAGIPDVSGAVRFTGTLAGPSSNPQINLSFTGDSISYHKFPLDSVNGQLQYHDKKLLFQNTNFSGRLNRLDSLEPPFHISDLSGGFSYHGTLQGTIDNPLVNLNISLQNLSYRNYRINKASLDIILENREVFLKPSYVMHDSVNILLKGYYELKQARGIADLAITDKDIPETFSIPVDSSAETFTKYPLGVINSSFDLSNSSDWKIKVNAHHLDIKKISDVLSLRIPIAGKTEFSLNFFGRPADPRGKLNFALKSFYYDGTSIDSIRGSLVLNHSELEMDSLTAFIKGGQTKISGQIELMHSTSRPVYVSRKSHVSVQAEGHHLSLEILEPFLPAQSKLTGFLDYNIDLSGRIRKPTISGDVDISRGSFLIDTSAPGFDEVAMNIQFQDSLFILKNLQWKYLQTPFQMSGQFVTMDWHNFQTEFLLQAAGKEAARISGNLAADSLRMRLDVNNLDLVVMQPFAPSITGLKGNMNANVVIHGSFKNPLLFGQLKLNQLTLNPPGLTEKITQGKIIATLDGHKIMLDSLSTKLNGGSVKATGQITLDQYKLTDLNFHTSLFKVSIKQPDLFSVTIDTALLTYQKTDEFYHLNGDVWLGKSKFTQNIEPPEIIQMLRSAQGPSREPSALQKKTKLNVRLHETKNLFVDNNLAKIQLDAALEFIGTLARPNISGRMQVEKGYVMYLDRKFQVDTAIVYFSDPNKLNPNVTLTAVSRVTVYERQQSTTYNITLSITGPLDQPIIDLTSNPPLNKSDILSVLTLGTTTENLFSSSATTSSVTDLFTRRVESLSSQRITGFLSTRVGNLLGFDQITIEGNIFRFNQGGAPQLVATKTFLKRFEVTYSTTVGHLNDQGVRLDYHISRHWAIQGETNQTGETGIDLKYQINFK
jgi:autotransporter translocation and assembly factor TamB